MEGIHPIGMAVAFLVFGALFILQSAFGSRPSGTQISGRDNTTSRSSRSSLDKEIVSTKNKPTRIQAARTTPSGKSGNSMSQEHEGMKQIMQDKIESYRGIIRPHKPSKAQMENHRVKLLLD